MMAKEWYIMFDYITSPVIHNRSSIYRGDITNTTLSILGAAAIIQNQVSLRKMHH
jgi:hypothetical protein